MGIQDRDYYREGPSFLDRFAGKGAIVWLIAITVGVYFGEMLTYTRDLLKNPIVQIGVYDPKLILQGEVWRLLTSVFLHASIWHVFVNMFLLYWAGQRLEEVYGSTEFVLFYLFAGVGANVLYLITYLVGLSGPNPALGASGAVTAVLVLFAFHFPRAKILLFFVIPLPAWLLVLVYVGLDLLGAMNGGTNVAHVAHLGGAFAGLLYYQSGIQFTQLIPRRSRTRARPRLRVVPPPEEREPEPVGASVPAQSRPAEAADEQLEAKLDAVLEKVSKHGQDSLTPEEREILVKASELYKKRRK